MFRRTTTAQQQITAAQLAEDRIDLIKLEPLYANLPSYVAPESTIPGYPDFRRTTAVVQKRDSTARGIRDYHVVTVQVMAPGRADPVVGVHSAGAP
jgi:hypothetical protein